MGLFLNLLIWASALNACPIVTSTLPAEGDTIASPANIIIHFDSLDSPIDEDSLSLGIEMHLYTLLDPCLTYYDGELIFDMTGGCIYLEGPERVEVCVSWYDQNGMCDSVRTYCWWFFIEAPPCLPCRVRVDGTMADEVEPLDSLYNALRTKYCDFRIDTYPVWDVEVYPESCDVYGVLWNGWHYPDSIRDRFIEFVYNGGILVLFGETCLARPGAAISLLEDTDWDLGLSYYDATVKDRVDYAPIGGSEAAIYRNFSSHPLVEHIPGPIVLDRGGIINVTPPAQRLVWGQSTTMALDCDSLPDEFVYEYGPTLVGLSHYGEGIVVYHADYTNWSYEFYPSVSMYYNFELILELFDCSKVPKFTYNPEKYDTVSLISDTLYLEVIVENYGAIEPDSLTIFFEGFLFDVSSPSVSIIDSIFTFETHVDSLTDSVYLCIQSICDTGGYWPYDSICWWYYIDHTGIEEAVSLPVDFEVRAYPNPFNSSISFVVSSAGVLNSNALRLEIYDITGRLLERWKGGEPSIQPSSHPTIHSLFSWSPDPSLSSGIYLYKITAGKAEKKGKVLLLK